MDFLGLPRALAQEAFALLRGERRLQVNLSRILGAARYKVLTQNRIYHVKCPKKWCPKFQHMLQCYRLTERVVTGSDVAPFLVKMARVTVIPDGAKRIPYTVEYNPEEGIPERQRRRGIRNRNERGRIYRDREGLEIAQDHEKWAR